MTDVVELTKSEIIDLIDATDASIEEIRSISPKEVVPEHDFYRGVMFGECISCGNRFVDSEGCEACEPAKEFLQKYRDVYPWASDKKRT